MLKTLFGGSLGVGLLILTPHELRSPFSPLLPCLQSVNEMNPEIFEGRELLRLWVNAGVVKV